MKSLLFITLVSLTVLSFGQKNNQLSFSAGTALPLGNFKKSDVNDVNSGYAKNGRHLELTYSRRLAREFSLRLSLMEASNKMNSEPELRQYANGLRVSDGDNTWSTFSIMLGVAKKIKFAESRFSIEPDIHVGCAFTRRPQHFIPSNSQERNSSEVIEEKRASSLSIQLGLRSYYSLSDSFSFFIACAYFTASPEFDFNGSTINKNSASILLYNQDVRLLTLNGGLSYSF